MGNIEEIKNEEKTINNSVENKKKGFSIFGFTIWDILEYFIIYSILGYIIETIFGLITKGVIESRQSFLYGPFCAIYGIGAVIMIMGLQRFNKNNYTLFFGGFIIGSIVEYIISLIGEFIFHIKWWDYSDMPFNIEGRICIWFSFFWGILAIYLMSHVHPKIDNMLKKINAKVLKISTIIIIIFLFFNFLITSFALRMFFTRLVADYNLELENVEAYFFDYERMYQNKNIKYIVDKFLNDEKMLKTFPNIKVTGKDGKIILVRDILTDIKPYYFRIFEPATIEK